MSETRVVRRHELAAGTAAHRSAFSRLPSWAWFLFAIAATLIVCVARIIQEPRFFFWDDTQLGAFGQWYGLGSRILSGQVTLLSPGSWQGGNYLAEGQWGLWNPVTWLIALGTHLMDSATIFTTLVKVFFLLLLVAGAFLLAREYGADPWWAAVGGSIAAFGGQTIFMDAPSWVTGLQNIALFAFCWWSLKRHVTRGKSPLPFFLFAYVLITFGYVFGVIELAALLLVVLVSELIARDRQSIFRVLVLGIYAALLTVFVYLPSVLTSSVTTRSGADILNDQFLNMDLGDLATSSVSTAVSSVRGYWGDLLPVPLQYVTWLLPLLVLLSLRGRQWFSGLVAPLAVLVFTLALVLGPSVIGPLRYPARMMPYAVLAVAVVFAALASRGWPERPGRFRVVSAVALTAVAGWLSWAAQPSSWYWVLLATLLQSALIVVITWPRRGDRFDPAKTAAALLLASVLVLVPQIIQYPSSPLGNFNVPSSVSAMAAVGDEMDDGIMTVGDVYSLQNHPDAYSESLLANLWYLTGKDTASVYTVLPFATFANDLCIDLRGWTCADALGTLFEEPDHPLADDLALNTVVVIKGTRLEDPPSVPAGWTLSDGEYTWTLHRVDPVPAAGGVVRSDAGVASSTTSQDATSVSIRIDKVPPDGGDIVLSRLAWPGYTASGGSLDDPERGYLLTLHVEPKDAGSTIMVRFLPPGWWVEVGSAAAALLIASASAFWWAILRRRQTT